MKAFWDSVQLRHAPEFFLQRGVVRRNFEVPARAEALLEGCRALGLSVVQPGPAPRDALEAVHDPAYLDFLRDGPRAWAALPEAGSELVPNIHPSPEMMESGAQPGTGVIGQLGWYTADTSCPISAATWQAAETAAACAIAAAEEAAAGRHAYALCRPPGHHAYGARAGGHCYLNNAAIAAQHLRDRGAARIAVLDVDSHHGNGTQGIFWRRADVLFVSVHGDPNGYYPWYVGHAREVGAGEGEGFTRNLPLSRGTDSAGWLAAVAAGLDVTARFGPDAIVLSLGFDASVNEPLGFLAVEDDAFTRMAEQVVALGRSVAVVQEGGYAVDHLGALLRLTLAPFT